MSTAHDGDDTNLLEAGAAEDFRAFVDGGTGGEHIVDEHRASRSIRDPLEARAGDFKRAAKVCHALFPAEKCLGFGLTDPPEGSEHRQADVF